MQFSDQSISGISAILARMLASDPIYLWLICSWELPSLGLRFTGTLEVYSVITTEHATFRITTFNWVLRGAVLEFSQRLYFSDTETDRQGLLWSWDLMIHITSVTTQPAGGSGFDWSKAVVNFFQIRVTVVHPLCSFPGRSSLLWYVFHFTLLPLPISSGSPVV